jgi:hypothetical protein
MMIGQRLMELNRGLSISSLIEIKNNPRPIFRCLKISTCVAVCLQLTKMCHLAFNQQIFQAEVRIFLHPQLIYSNNNSNNNRDRFHPNKLGLVLQCISNSKLLANLGLNHQQTNLPLWHQGSNQVVV